MKNSAVGTISEDVINAFADLGYNVKNGDVKAMITEYQLDHEIIASTKDPGTGTFGPKTRASLAAEHGVYSNLQDSELKIIEENKKLLLSERELWQEKTLIIEGKVSAIGSPKRGDKGEHVATLQQVLADTGFFRGKSTGLMTGSTVMALKQYQKSRGLRPTGRMDAATKTHIVEDMLSEVG